MKILVGLGNPGKEFENTRHNAGFMVVDEIMQKSKIKMQNNNVKFKNDKKIKAEICQISQIGQIGELLLVKPQDFMNQSGLAVLGVKRKHPELKNEDIYVVHDDLDIPLGEYKIQFGRSSAGHHGVESIIKELGTKDFWRIRIGINTGKFKSLRFKGLRSEQYVLQKFPKKERIIIDETINTAIKELLNAL